MKNYIVMSVLLGIGIVLLMGTELSTIILGVLWFALLWLSGHDSRVRKHWKKYWKTNIRMMKVLGVY